MLNTGTILVYRTRVVTTDLVRTLNNNCFSTVAARIVDTARTVQRCRLVAFYFLFCKFDVM